MNSARRAIIICMRLTFSMSVLALVTVGSFVYGMTFSALAGALFPPIIGEPSTDPSGRGMMSAPDVGLGPLICVLLGSVAGWLAWLWTDRKHWSVDLAVASPIFLAFSVITAANYVEVDIVFTRDAQAVLNVALAASGIAVVLMLQRTTHNAKSVFLYVLGSAVLVFSTYAFVAIPLWYTLSYLSWKLGAGELDSLDAAAKAISAAASLLIFFGLSWKDGRLKFSATNPK